MNIERIPLHDRPATGSVPLRGLLLQVVLATGAVCTLAGAPVHAQELTQVSFRHEARGAAELESTDSGLIVRGLGNGPEDRVALLLGSAPTDQSEAPSFLVQLGERIATLPVSHGLQYDLFGTEAGGLPEVHSSLRIMKSDTETATYAITFKAPEEIHAQFADDRPMTLDTGQFMFTVGTGVPDSIPEQVECGCYRERYSETPVCKWEVRWNMPVEIKLPGIDSTFHSDRISVTGIGSDSFPERITSLELSAESKEMVWIAGEGIRRKKSIENHHVYVASGDVTLRIMGDNRIAAIGLENGTRDGIDVWNLSEGSDEGVFRANVQADLRNPEACIFLTFQGDSDTLGYLGLVRDTIGIRLLARIEESDSNRVNVITTSGEFSAPQNQVLGWIIGNAQLTDFNCYFHDRWRAWKVYSARFVQSIMLQHGMNVYPTETLLFEPGDYRSDNDLIEQIRIRAGDIDTVFIGSISQYSDIEESKQAENTGLTMRIIQRDAILYIEYNGADPGRGRLRIVDMTGRPIHEVADLRLKTNGTVAVEAWDLPTGVYLIELKTDGGGAVGKFVLMR